MSSTDNSKATSLPEKLVGKKRLRTARACDLCKRKKIKCHFIPGQSCFNCQGYNVPCVFTEGPPQKRGVPKGYAEKLEQQIATLQQKIHALSGSNDIDRLLDQYQQQPRKRVVDDHGNGHGNNDGDDDDKSRPAKLSDSFVEELDALHSRQYPPGVRYDSVKYLGDLDNFLFFSNKLRLHDNNKGLKWKGHYLRRVGNDIVLVEDNSNIDSTVEDKVPRINWKPMSISRLPRSIHHYVLTATGLDQYTSARLLKIYFANVHPILPVIDKGEFLLQYRDKIASYPQVCLLLSMFGAAARFAECESLDEERRRRVPPDARWDMPVGWSDHFFEKALKIISDGINQPTLGKIQALVLIQNQRANVDSESSAIWLMGGFAVRLAQGLGLHRNCEHWPIPDNDKQSRYRTWWALYVCDRFQAALHGRPLTIVDEDNDVPYPEVNVSWKEVLDEPDSDDNDEWPGPRFPSATYRPASIEGSVRFNIIFLQLVKLSEILGRIWRGLHTSKAKQQSYMHGSDSIVRRLDQELTEWRFSFSHAIKEESNNFADFNESNGYFAGVIGSTLMFYFTALILLHRPFIKANPTDQSSFWICTSAATRGIRMASLLTAHDFLLTPYSFSTYPILQCSLILMYNTKNSDPQIAQAAKEDLQRGIDLIDRIHELSITTRKLRVLLHNIIDNRNIDHHFMDDHHYNPPYPHVIPPVSHNDPISSTQQASIPSSSQLPPATQDVASIIDTFLLQQDMTFGDTIPAPSITNPEEAFTLQQFNFLASQAQDLPALPNFRNEPSNPFWDIPSSIDWGEWAEWHHYHAQNLSAWDQTS